MPLSTIDTSSISGLGYGFKNRLINGGMAIWQRGTSLTGLTPSLGVPAYTADRWFVNQLGSQSATDVAQQTGGSTKYSARIQKRVGSTGASINQFGQVIENLNCLDLPNQRLTLSFTAKAGANYSATSSLLNVYIYTCTAADQSSTAFVNGTATGQATLYSGTVTLTTSNQTFTITTSAVGASATNVCVLFSETSSASAAGANDWYEISDVQLEKGTVATSFDYRPYGTELALCQRYYQVIAASSFLPAGVFSTNRVLSGVPYNNCMRTAPTGSIASGGFTFFISGAANSSSTVAVGSGSAGYVSLDVGVTATTGTAGVGSTTSNLTLSAEL
jgi:hypothetical protein